MRKGIKNKLKALAGEYTKFNHPLGKYTSLKVGGRAEALCLPRTTRELARILAFVRTEGIEVNILGGGANTYIRSRLLKGLTICLKSPSFGKCTVSKSRMYCAAGMSINRLVRTAAACGLTGLEFMSGIPGTVGGAIFMNAGGGYDSKRRTRKDRQWISDVLEWIAVMKYNGRIVEIHREDIPFAYRRSGIKGAVIIGACFKLRKMNVEAVTQKNKKIIDEKKSKQDLAIPSSGCFFKNPPRTDKTAGQIIEECGLKGRRFGGAEISRKHANFIINTGGASSDDVDKLARFVKSVVKRKTGIVLKEEVRVL